MQPCFRILVVTYNFPPLGTVGGSIRVVKQIKYLSESGWQFAVLAPDRFKKGNWTVQPDSANLILHDIPKEVEVFRTKAWSIQTGSNSNSAANNHGSVFATRISYLKFFLNRFIKKWNLSAYIFPDSEIPWIFTAVPIAILKARQAKIDLVYAVSPPITSVVIGWLISLLTGKPLIVDYKDDRIGVGTYQSSPQLIRRLHQFVEHLIVQHAKYVISVTPSSLAGFQQRYPRENINKFVLLPNGADLEEYKSNNIQNHIDPILPKAKFTIINGGGYAPTYRNASTFLRAVGLLLLKRPEFIDVLRIIFIGEGAALFYGKLLEELRIEPIFEEVPTMGRQDFVALLKQADLLLLIQTLGYQTSVAGTFYEYWATGKAPIMIVGEQGDMWNLLNTHHLGVTVKHDDVQGITNAIEAYIDAKLLNKAKHISQEGIEQYDRRRLAERLGKLFQNVLHNNTLGAK